MKTNLKGFWLKHIGQGACMSFCMQIKPKKKKKKNPRENQEITRRLEYKEYKHLVGESGLSILPYSDSIT